MTAHTIQGDLIKLAQAGSFDVIVHGCNCFHTMGAGIAGQLAKACPDVLDVDRRQSIFGDNEKLGGFTSVRVPRENGTDLVIVNAYTQFRPGPFVDYQAVRGAFHNIAHTFPDAHIAYPKIGAGIGGGDWDIIKHAIDWHLRAHEHTFVEYRGG